MDVNTVFGILEDLKAKAGTATRLSTKNWYHPTLKSIEVAEQLFVLFDPSRAIQIKQSGCGGIKIQKMLPGMPHLVLEISPQGNLEFSYA